MQLAERIIGATLLPVTRRVDFPGKRRLRGAVRLPQSGVHEVRLVGARFRLDLTESLHRDYYFGLCDQFELGLIRRLLAHGGDFVDAGAHIGLYSVCVARMLAQRGRVLAFEPNPVSRARLAENLALNDCSNVIVSACAVAAASGRTSLHVPLRGDTAWSSLEAGAWAESKLIEIETTTLDAEIARYDLRPAVVKIDVEGYEVPALAGAAATIERRPALLVELAPENAAEAVSSLVALGYSVTRVGTRRLEPWTAKTGASNALFLQPGHRALLNVR